jgi:DNA adenine methylase
MYGIEWSDSDHSEFLEIVQNLEGFCIISGYACELYEPVERAGWQREDKVAVNNSGDKRTESLWMCPRTVEASSGMLF